MIIKTKLAISSQKFAAMWYGDSADLAVHGVSLSLSILQLCSQLHLLHPIPITLPLLTLQLTDHTHKLRLSALKSCLEVSQLFLQETALVLKTALRYCFVSEFLCKNMLVLFKR